MRHADVVALQLAIIDRLRAPIQLAGVEAALLTPELRAMAMRSAAYQAQTRAYRQMADGLEGADAWHVGPDVTAPLVAQLSQIASQRNQTLAALAALDQRHDSWHAAQQLLSGIEDWRQRVAANIDTLDWRERRLLMDVMQLRVEVWRANHEPRLRIHSLLDPALTSSDQYDKWYWSQLPTIRLEWESV